MDETRSKVREARSPAGQVDVSCELEKRDRHERPFTDVGVWRPRSRMQEQIQVDGADVGDVAPTTEFLLDTAQ